MAAPEGEESVTRPDPAPVTDGRMADRGPRYTETPPDPYAPGSPPIAGWWVDSFGMASALGLPIGRRSHVIGVLMLDDSIPRQFSAEELGLAASTLERVAPIIERAREMEQRTLRLEAATAIRRRPRNPDAR